jgi:hypothetical protein
VDETLCAVREARERTYHYFIGGWTFLTPKNSVAIGIACENATDTVLLFEQCAQNAIA